MKSLKIIKKEYQRVGYDAQDIEPVEYTEGYAEYDDHGRLTREERYEPDGTLNTLTVNAYNDNGELIQTEQYDQDNILLQKTVTQYDDNQRLAAQSNYYGDASEEYVTKYYYDAGNNVVKQEVYVDGKLDYVEKTATYQDGRLDTETENDDTVEVYSLTGHRICKTHLSQLGISLGSRPSAVVTLPHTVMNGMGNTPYIVRRIQ